MPYASPPISVLMGSSLLYALLATLAAVHVSALPSAGHNVTLEARAVDYSIPSSWRKPTTTRSWDNMRQIARDTMLTMISFKGSNSNQNIGGMNYWPSANVWSSIVLTDFATEKRDFIGTTLDAVGDTFGQNPNFVHNDYNDDTLWWALAAVYQYRTYGDTVAQGWAKSSWQAMSRYQITGTSGNGKNFNWNANCGGETTVGGVFWRSKTDDDYANSITTSLFMTLSAYLYEQTKDEKYFQAAEQARLYVYRQLFYKNSDKLITDGINLKTCKLTDWKFTYNAGKYIEGLAVLYSAKNWGFYIDDAITVAIAGMKKSSWQGSDGIITEGQATPYSDNDDARNFKGVYIRGLVELYRRAPGNADLRKLIRAYVNVQANAVIDLASNNPSSPSKFGVNWHGPMDAGYAHGQLAVLDVMQAFVTVNRP